MITNKYSSYDLQFDGAILGQITEAPFRVQGIVKVP